MAVRSLYSALVKRAAGRWAEVILLLLFLVSLLAPPAWTGTLQWRHWLWLAGLAAVLVLAGSRGRGEGPPEASATAVKALALLLLLNAAVALSGGIDSPLWAGYFIFMLASSSRFSRWWQQASFLGVITVLEAGQLTGLGRVLPGGGVTDGGLLRLGAALALLAFFTVLLNLFFVGRQIRLQKDLEEHARLRREAEEFERIEEDRPGSEPEAYSPQGKMIRQISVAQKLNRDLDRLLALARRAVEARTTALFESDGDLLVLRRYAEGEARIDRKARWRIGEGLIGGAAKLGQPVIVSDLANSRHRVNYLLEGESARSLMIAPVKEQGVLRGVLVAEHPFADKFSRGEQEIFEGFSLEVNLLLENFRNSSMRDRRRMTMETLNALSRTLSSTREVEEMLNSLVEQVREVVPYDQCAVFLVDPGKRRLVLRAQRGFNFDPKGKEHFPLTKGLVGHIVHRGQPLVFTDRKKMQIVPGYTGREKMRAFMGLPLRFRDDLEGAMIFASSTAGSFTHYHLEILQLLANQVAAQISNAFLHRQMERMARTDGLTGLYNHRHFQERLAHEVERSERHGQQLSLLFLDIDHFKKVNDTYGHPFGDKILKGVARRVSKIARRIDFVARYGGEEFAFILPGTGRGGCNSIAERILTSVRAGRFEHEGTTVKVTVSVGSAVFPEDGPTKEEMILRSDRALYLAKESGRDRHRTFRDVAGR